MDPFLEEVAEVTELKIVMFRAAMLGCRAGDGRNGVDEVGRAIGRATDLATVSVLIGRATAWTNSANEAVCQEDARCRIVSLGNFSNIDVITSPQGVVYALGNFDIFRRVRAVIEIEPDTEVGEIVQVFAMHPVDERFGGDALTLGTQHDGGSVRVVSADVDAVVAAQALVTGPDVGLCIFHQMPQMDGSVGIGQTAGDQ